MKLFEVTSVLFTWFSGSVAPAITYRKKMLLCQGMFNILNNTLFVF